MKNTLIIGYGNVDREDDGVAWHVLAGIARHLNRPVPTLEDGSGGESASASDEFEPSGDNPDLLFRLQLTPEMAETASQYERVCFVDAHTGAVQEDVNVVSLDPQFQASPFTHHMTPATLLSFAETLYGIRPEALLVSVRGYQFGFKRGLSQETERLSRQAVDQIVEWMEAGSG